MDSKSNDDSGGSDSLDKSMQRKCVMVESTTTTATTTTSATESDNCSRDCAALQQEEELGQGQGEEQNVPRPPGGNNNTTTTTTTAFETKVKQISQNLKETKLAEEQEEVDGADQEEEPSGDRMRKVRFHPDAKENDGGSNRVKKKWKSSQNHGGDGANLGCDGMEMDEGDEEQQPDEEEDEEEEEEFNLAKTMAEAEDYLKQHPLTFVRRSSGQQNGELKGEENVVQIGVDGERGEEEKIEVDDEDDEDEDSERDFYKNCKAENGIQRVLGKETKAGKVEYLLRFGNNGDLSWESEDFTRCMCPTLLKLYEQNRERRQQRLMHHVAKRQSLRQRYTDF
ncbi:hypothetical protein KR044_008013 [Drosophila immigrans]|nr:hypothetical protein KR044_008013 [Drosophila immigrans]